MNDWVTYRLGDPNVSSIVMGQSPDSATYNLSREGLPFFQGKADFGVRYPMPKTWCSAPTRVAEPGDILVSVRAPVGDANIALERCCIGRGIAALRPGPGTHGEFLFYLLLHHKPDLDGLGSGAIFKAVNKDTLRDFEIALPSVVEQRAIAAVLAKIQTAVEVQEKIVATLKELKAATMAKLFREGLREEPLKQTEIGEIPESWEVVRLGEVARIRYGLGQPPELLPDGVAMIRATDISRGRISSKEVLRVRRESIPISRNPFLKAGDIIVVRSGAYTGDAAVITDEWEGAVAGYDLIVTPLERLDSHFAVNFLLSQDAQAYFRRQRDRAAQPHINSQQLSEMLLPLPALAEQRAIAQILRSIDDKTADSERKRDSLKSLFSSMLHLLMTGQVRVNNLRLEEILAHVS